jgi:hypothetical protein
MLGCVSVAGPRQVFRFKLTRMTSVIVGRLLVGYAVGTITGVAPVFGAEIAKVCFPSTH